LSLLADIGLHNVCLVPEADIACPQERYRNIAVQLIPIVKKWH